MNKIFIFFIALVFIACNKPKFGFTSSDCGEVYNNCMRECIKTNTRSVCINNCDKSRSMCQSIKIKGCMQDCNSKYGKNTSNSEICKKRCMDNKGISF